MAGIKRVSNRYVTRTSNTSPVKITDVPDAPTIGTATKSGTTASVTFTPSAKGGLAATFQVDAFVGGNITSPLKSGTGTGSPISVTGLSTGTSYTFKVKAINTTGTSGYSGASNSITI